MCQKRFTDKEIIDALSASLGVHTDAAKILGCERSTISKALKKRPAVAKAHEEILEERLDIAETALFRAVKERQPWAIKFLLQSKRGSDRGYGNTQKIELRHSPMETVSDETLENIVNELNGNNN